MCHDVMCFSVGRSQPLQCLEIQLARLLLSTGFSLCVKKFLQISDGHERVLKIVFILHKIKLNE